jgi:hypothetical protein
MGAVKEIIPSKGKALEARYFVKIIAVIYSDPGGYPVGDSVIGNEAAVNAESLSGIGVYLAEYAHGKNAFFLAECLKCLKQQKQGSAEHPALKPGLRRIKMPEDSAHISPSIE